MSKILVTPRSVTRNGHPSLERLREAGYEIVFPRPGVQPNEDELIQLLPGCVGYLAGVEKVTCRVLESADVLRVISRNGTGVDNVDLEAAARLNIVVCRAEGANARGVAELTIALMLALARQIPFSDAGIKGGGWSRRQGVELEGRTLGLVGCGRIGKLVAGFALAFGMKVLAYDVFVDESFKPSPDFTFAPLERVLAESDFISLHCPSPSDGKPIINSSALGSIKQGAYIVNTARASLVDEEALLAAIEAGRISGYAMDVFDQEPPVGSRLVLSDRVIATPHVGGFTEESVSRAMSLAVDNLLRNLG
jgi:D-3-phosphoglycerate dehydrogenase / 2-oxoglutarate reductase